MSALYQMVTDTIIEALERGVVPWRKPWDSTNPFPVNAQTNRPYRGVNVFLLSMRPFTDHRWLTFKQAHERGGRVMPGEKSTSVVFWKRWAPGSRETEEVDDGVVPRRQVPLLRYFNVFNAEQCEGLGLPELYRPDPPEDSQRNERADLMIRTMPDPPKIVENGRAAWYSPSEDIMSVPPLARFRSVDAFYATLFHELGHATGSERRLHRPGVTGEFKFGSGEYSKEELVAELTSAFCCAVLGLDNSLVQDAASYLNGWLSILKADPKAMVIAAAQAQRAADYIRGVMYGNS